MIGVNAKIMCARTLGCRRGRQAANHVSPSNGPNLHQRGELSEPKPSGVKEKTLEVLWLKTISTAASYTCRRNLVAASSAITLGTVTADADAADDAGGGQSADDADDADDFQPPPGAVCGQCGAGTGTSPPGDPPTMQASVSGQTIWLHRECEPFFQRAQP